MTLPAELAGARRVLAVQPHYDDNDIGAGGTLAALADAGAELHYLTVTDDRVGVLDASLSETEAREGLRREQAKAAAEIGVAGQAWLDLSDAGDWTQGEARRGVIEQIRRVRPDLVVSVDPWLPTEAHGDHLKTGRAVAEAVMWHRFPRLVTRADVDERYRAEAPGHRVAALALYFTVEPTVFVDVGATRERKHRALDAYRLQFEPEGLAFLHRGLEARERQWAEGRGFSHGEPIRVLRPHELHCHFDPALRR